MCFSALDAGAHTPSFNVVNFLDAQPSKPSSKNANRHLWHGLSYALGDYNDQNILTWRFLP